MSLAAAGRIADLPGPSRSEGRVRSSRSTGGASSQQIVDEIAELAVGTRFLMLAPLVKERKGEHREPSNSRIIGTSVCRMVLGLQEQG